MTIMMKVSPRYLISAPAPTQTLHVVLNEDHYIVILQSNLTIYSMHEYATFYNQRYWILLK